MGYSDHVGFAAAAEANKPREKSRKQTTIFWKEDGEEKVIRYLSDDIYTVPIHEFIPTKRLTKDNKQIKAEFVCSEALAEPRECIICNGPQIEGYGGALKDPYPVKRTLGIAVLREEKPNGDVVDVLHEEPVKVTVDGAEKEVADLPVVGIIKQGFQNYWNMIPYARYKTSMDRDYVVTRKGKGKDTIYVHDALDVDPERGTAKNAAESSAKLAKVYELAIASHPTLVEYIEKMGSKERYDYFLSDQPDEEEESVESDPEDAPDFAKPQEESSLGLKLMGHRKKPASEDPPF